LKAVFYFCFFFFSKKIKKIFRLKGVFLKTNRGFFFFGFFWVGGAFHKTQGLAAMVCMCGPPWKAGRFRGDERRQILTVFSGAFKGLPALPWSPCRGADRAAVCAFVVVMM